MGFDQGFDVELEHSLRASPDAAYRAWTEGLDRWLAVPGTVALRAAVGAPFFFETEHQGNRHPHYGRFFALDPGRRLEMGWVSLGTLGQESRLTLEFHAAEGGGTRVRLRHAGLPNEEFRRGHAEAWPAALALIDAIPDRS